MFNPLSWQTGLVNGNIQQTRTKFIHCQHTGRPTKCKSLKGLSTLFQVFFLQSNNRDNLSYGAATAKSIKKKLLQ